MFSLSNFDADSSHGRVDLLGTAPDALAVKGVAEVDNCLTVKPGFLAARLLSAASYSITASSLLSF